MESYSFPAKGSDRGYWVYGELTLSTNKRLYNDTYNFEYHEYSGSIAQKDKTAVRNGLTWIGGKYSGSDKEDKGYKMKFTKEQPECHECLEIPSKCPP